MKQPSSKKLKEAIARGRLALALLKERFAYRRYFETHSKGAIAAFERYRKGEYWYWEQADWQTLLGSDLKALNFFHCEEQFGFGFPFWRFESADDVLLFLDPIRSVEDIPEKLEPVLAEMFSREWISQVEHEGVPLRVLMYEWPRVAMLLPKKLESYQRLLLVDLRGSHTTLKKRFAEFLDSVEKNRRNCPEPQRREDWLTYGAWVPDNHRERQEVWHHLKVWKLRRQKKGFPEIARRLRMTIPAAKMSFYRAHELIEGRRYDREKFKLKNWTLKECATCPDNPDGGGTCKSLCPDAEARIGIPKDIDVSRKKDIQPMEVKHVHADWLNKEARELQTKEDEQN